MAVYKVLGVALTLLFAFPVFSQYDAFFNGSDEATYTKKGWIFTEKDTTVCVSAVSLTKNNEAGTSLHLRFEILQNWQTVDSSEYDLIIDTTEAHALLVDDRTFPALRFTCNEMAISIEIPGEVKYTSRSGEEKKYWYSTFMVVDFPKHLSRFQTIFPYYLEK